MAWLNAEKYANNRFLRLAPTDSWIRQYYEEETKDKSSNRYSEWLTHLILYYPRVKPPHIVRYVPSMIHKYVRGPFPVHVPLELAPLGNTTYAEEMELLDQWRHAAANTQQSYVCCRNTCSFVKRGTTCGFCMPIGRVAQHAPCLCDCLIFQYCIIWRGEFVRRLRDRFYLDQALYFKFEERVRGFDRWIAENVALGSTIFGFLRITLLISHVLAAMGFAPSRVYHGHGAIEIKVLRCHLCFTVIRLDEIVIRIPPSSTTVTMSAASNSSSTAPVVIVVDDFVLVSSEHVKILDSCLEHLNELHGRANCFCPYVRRPFTKLERQTESVYNGSIASNSNISDTVVLRRSKIPTTTTVTTIDAYTTAYWRSLLLTKYAPLTIYTTRFNLHGCLQPKMWNLIVARYDPLFARTDNGLSIHTHHYIYINDSRYEEICAFRAVGGVVELWRRNEQYDRTSVEILDVEIQYTADKRINDSYEKFKNKNIEATKQYFFASEATIGGGSEEEGTLRHEESATDDKSERNDTSADSYLGQLSEDDRSVSTSDDICIGENDLDCPIFTIY